LGFDKGRPEDEPTDEELQGFEKEFEAIERRMKKCQ
jgi:hypothetical protein